ncbi:peptidase associated/transthyretin-like domain-containing protein [Derxia lacustris]|uniref:carboxypeptidase-like regulatory domain-containing protein n=1 Tax=Derxia lacustris TaxID=764842 RepID=UPI00111BE8DA|nr:carboxypeptidase-like regulatory domain-containing protein [Derxia lacustris]
MQASRSAHQGPPALATAASALARRCMLAAVSALALLPAIAPAQSADALPPVHTQGLMRWVSGGIGLDESKAMRAAAAQWPLTLMFTQRADGRAAYASDVRIVVADDNGYALIDAVADGPFMLVDVPTGHYRLSATLNGLKQEREIDVATGKPQKLDFAW